MQLHNKVDRKLLRQQLEQDTEKRITLSFYQYAHIGNPQLFRDHIYIEWDSLGVLGRVYVAKEGINAQISVPNINWEAFKKQLDNISFLKGIRLNIAVEAHAQSFIKLKIKVKDKIVADGLNDDTFDVTNTGKHVGAKEFNELTSAEDTVLIDMRNHYESEVGHFKGAITPDVDTFRDSLPLLEGLLQGQEDKNIVMYCTGGIRCEKAGAWFKHKGFKHVHQLEGGIIEYARQVKEQGLANKFKGKNFVFDDRLGERISDEIISNCHQCGEACDTHTNCRNEACHLLFIQCENCAEQYAGCCSEDCQTFNALPLEEQREQRKGIKKEQNIFRKGRSEVLKYKK